MEENKTDDDKTKRRRQLTAERARAYRQRKKALGSQLHLNKSHEEPPTKLRLLEINPIPSTSQNTLTNCGTLIKVIECNKVIEDSAPGDKIIPSDAEKKLRRSQLNAERCRRYRERRKAEKFGVTSQDSNTSRDTFNSCATSTNLKSTTDTNISEISPDSTQNLSAEQISSQVVQESTTAAAEKARRFRARRTARRLNAQSDPSATYSLYLKHNAAHNRFETLFEKNPFGVACTVCDRLWFENELKSLPKSSSTFLRKLCPTASLKDILVCSACKYSLLNKKIPNLAVYNGFKYPPKPNLPDLDLVSERLISPRLPFIQIRLLRFVKEQYGIIEQVINVPVDVCNVVKHLPRSIDEDFCINVHLENKIIYRSSRLQGLIKTETIREWLNFLVNTPIYKHYNIKFSNEFLNQLDADNVNQDIHLNKFEKQIIIDDNIDVGQHTLLWSEDKYWQTAPGQKKKLNGLLFDDHVEELFFPAIYYGQFREFKHGVNSNPYSMAMSELRRSDRRGVTPRHLLYLAMKIIQFRVSESTGISLKHVEQGTTLTKKQELSSDYLNECIESNLGFLKYIPNSAQYWQSREKDLFAMIKQFGKPTIFVTMSANEISWKSLLRTLYRLKTNGTILTDSEIDQLHYKLKAELINEDAVTCAIYFNKLVDVIISTLQHKAISPFGQNYVQHYFKRIEFQYRGNPQAHILFWLNDAPKDAFGPYMNSAIQLINDLISVSCTESSGNINLVKHRHTFDCYKNYRNQRKCHFNTPFMPSRSTIILKPLPKSTEYQKRIYEENKVKYKKLYHNLHFYDYNDINDFYLKNGITCDEEYQKILSAGISHPTVFVKRNPNEKWHNFFNPFIFHHLKSYMDIQYITDDDSCASYVAKCVNKSNRGRNIQRDILKVFENNPDLDLDKITRHMTANMLNTIEMSSQEAAWFLLREPMSKSSVKVVYIPTVWPKERLRCGKTDKELEQLAKGDTNNWKNDCFDKYEKRPADLEDLTLIQFVAWYEVKFKKQFSKPDSEENWDIEHDDDVEIEEETASNGNRQNQQTSLYFRRKTPRAIRYRHYDMVNESLDYKREMVTLYIPFRNEERDILAEMRFLTIYEENEHQILNYRKEFEANLDMEQIIEAYKNICEHDENDDNMEILPLNQQQENSFAELYNNSESEIQYDANISIIKTETDQSHWSQLELDLIQCIRDEHPIIYTKMDGLTGYQRDEKIRIAWKQISNKFKGIPMAQIKRTWRSLLDNYLKIKIYAESIKKSGEFSKNKFIDGTLSFLEGQEDILLEYITTNKIHHNDSSDNESYVHFDENITMKEEMIHDDIGDSAKTTSHDIIKEIKYIEQNKNSFDNYCEKNIKDSLYVEVNLDDSVTIKQEIVDDYIADKNETSHDNITKGIKDGSKNRNSLENELHETNIKDALHEEVDLDDEVTIKVEINKDFEDNIVTVSDDIV